MPGVSPRVQSSRGTGGEEGEDKFGEGERVVGDGEEGNGARVGGGVRGRGGGEGRGSWGEKSGEGVGRRGGAERGKSQVRENIFFSHVPLGDYVLRCQRLWCRV